MYGNTITIVGNLTADPELRFTPNGSARVGFSVAHNRRWTDKATSEQKESTSFINVVAWRQLAENVAESLKKGSRVIVFGAIEQRSWETPEGDKRSAVELVAESVGPDLAFATAEVTKTTKVPAMAGGPAAPDLDEDGSPF